MTDKIKVIISNDQKDIKIPTGVRMLVRRCCNAVLRQENFEGSAEISVTFVNNEQIHKLNLEHRNIDRETDVLSFPLGENGVYDINHDTGAKMLGDIVISIEKALDSFEKITVNEKFGKLLRNGVKVFDNRMYSEEVEFNKLYRVYEDNGVFLGLGKRDEKGFKLEKLLIEE